MLHLNGKQLSFHDYPNGDFYLPQVKVAEIQNLVKLNQKIHIEAHLIDSNAIIQLMLLDTLLSLEPENPNSYNYNSIHTLTIKYLPYMQADIERENQITSLNVMMNIINNLKGFDRINIVGFHSEKTLHKYDNKLANFQLLHFENSFVAYVATMYKKHENLVFVAPDNGATKRTEHLMKQFMQCGFNNLQMIQCSKLRNKETGDLSNFQIDEIKDVMHPSRFIIVDDVSVNGGTFAGVAKLIRESYSTEKIQSIDLIVNFVVNMRNIEGIENVFAASDIISNHSHLHEINEDLYDFYESYRY